MPKAKTRSKGRVGGNEGGSGPIGGGSASRVALLNISKQLRSLAKLFHDWAETPIGGVRTTPARGGPIRSRR